MTVTDGLVAFLKAVAWEASGGNSLRHEITVGALFGTPADGSMAEIRVGHGPHAWQQVLYTPGRKPGEGPAVPVEMDIEAAAALFVADHFGRRDEAEARLVASFGPPGFRTRLVPDPADPPPRGPYDDVPVPEEPDGRPNQ